MRILEQAVANGDKKQISELVIRGSYECYIYKKTSIGFMDYTYVDWMLVSSSSNSSKAILLYCVRVNTRLYEDIKHMFDDPPDKYGTSAAMLYGGKN